MAMDDEINLWKYLYEICFRALRDALKELKRIILILIPSPLLLLSTFSFFLFFDDSYGLFYDCNDT